MAIRPDPLAPTSTTETTAEEQGISMYFTDRGIEELQRRRGEEDVTLDWVATRLQEFVDLNPQFETPIERLATWLARHDDLDDELA